MENKKIVIVDGNSLINRAFFAMSELKNSKGVYTGGVHGLTHMLFNLIDQFKPTHFCVAFDLKGPTVRHGMYDAYKGTRKGMPEELVMQMPIMKEVLDVLNIPRIELQGFEADDLIGTIGKFFSLADSEVHIVTGDKDALQLVAHGMQVHITKKGITNLVNYDEGVIFEELGVHANQVIDFKGLSGDTSDNIPGIPGIGPKTAAKLLSEFKTVENLIEQGEKITNKRIKGLVNDYAEQALLSKKLATIFLDVPIDISEDYFRLSSPNIKEAIEVFQKYELKSLISKLDEDAVASVQVYEKTSAFEILKSDQLLKKLSAGDLFSFKFYHDVKPRSVGDIIAAIFMVGNEIFYLEDIENLTLLKPVFESTTIKKMGYDIKSEVLFLKWLGIELNGVLIDGYIATYLLEPSRKSYILDEVYEDYLQKRIPSEESILGKGAKRLLFGSLDQEERVKHCAAQIEAISNLNEQLKIELEKKDLYTLFESVEMPLVKVLATIEFNGFKVDPDEIEKINHQLIQKIEEIETLIYQAAGEPFNINSPKQLGVVLFEKLALPPVKKTKTGFSTSHDVLEKLASKHAIAEQIIEYRSYAKLKSTYVDGLKEVVDAETKRVHTSLNQTVTVTGRLSSTEPNLQNIPIRLPYGRKIRRFFVADEGSTLLAADYSQIELRVLAHLSKDSRLIEAFNHDLDIHTITAAQVFNIPEKDVTPLQRSRAKEVNFGIVYGMGDFGLSESLNISVKEAKLYIENYFKSYPMVQGFMKGIIEACKEKGYVETILKRRREVPDIHNSNFMLRSAAERIARNTPIQGSAADIIKLAMIKVQEALDKGHFKAKLILQVHDELILNVPNEELDAVMDLLKNAMESAYPLDVPLKVDVNTGRSWYDVK